MEAQIIAETTKQSRTKPLQPELKQQLAIHVLSKTSNISQLSRIHQVSRKFLYANADKANQALQQAYLHTPTDEAVLYYLPITKAFIRQLVVALAFLCHASFRGIQALLSDVLDYRISLGSIHNYINAVVPKARHINQLIPLTNIKSAAHDEIFQARSPVLVGVDAQSTYCYLLESADHRDETTWGVHLLDLEERGLKPDKVIADFGRGLRAGHQAAWPDIPCWGDIFHPLMDLDKLVRFLRGRLGKAEDQLLKLELKMLDPKTDGRTLGRKLGIVRAKEAEARDSFEVISTLSTWMQYDIFGLHGPSHEDRRELFDFVVESLKKVESSFEYRIRPVRRMLENHKDELLMFAEEVDQKLSKVARHWDVEVSQVKELSRTLWWGEERSMRWHRLARHSQELGERYEEIMNDVEEALRTVIRASSMVENFNSRLRNYFFLRKQLGKEYLCVLQFYLNHARYQRSHRKEREGKSARELLTGEEHAHWLELLGFERFKRP